MFIKNGHWEDSDALEVRRFKRFCLRRPAVKCCFQSSAFSTFELNCGKTEWMFYQAVSWPLALIKRPSRLVKRPFLKGPRIKASRFIAPNGQFIKASCFFEANLKGASSESRVVSLGYIL